MPQLRFPMQVGRLIEEGASPFQPGSNMEPPLSRNNLTAVRVLNMTERVIMNGGDPSDGECGPGLGWVGCCKGWPKRALLPGALPLLTATCAAAVVCRR